MGYKGLPLKLSKLKFPSATRTRFDIFQWSSAKYSSYFPSIIMAENPRFVLPKQISKYGNSLPRHRPKLAAIAP